MCSIYLFVCLSFCHSPLKSKFMRAGTLFFLLLHSQPLEYCLAHSRSSVNVCGMSERMSPEQYMCNHRFDVLAILFAN